MQKVHKYIFKSKINKKNIYTKAPTGRTLLLDLDETLIHSCGLKENPDHIITAFESGSNVK